MKPRDNPDASLCDSKLLLTDVNNLQYLSPKYCKPSAFTETGLSFALNEY